MGRAISTQPDPEVVRTSFRGCRPVLYDFFTAAPSREFRAVAVERLGPAVKKSYKAGRNPRKEVRTTSGSGWVEMARPTRCSDISPAGGRA